MNTFLEKISTYQFLNYFIPGMVFISLIKYLGVYDLPLDNVLFVLLGGYCAGMVMSRIGSLIIEPILRKWRFIIFAPYKDYKDAEIKAPKVPILVAENNMYRTLLATFLSLSVIYGLNLITIVRGFMQSKWMPLAVLMGLTLLFLFSYRKQTSYIKQNIEHVTHKEENE